VFKAKIEEFRKAVQSLMGYRVDLHEGSCYHLHLGARGVLRFRRTPQGDFEMLESPLAADLLGDPRVRRFLEEEHSIPAFLAAGLLLGS